MVRTGAKRGLRVLSAVAVLSAYLWVAAASSASAAPPTATVVGTDELALRACPRADCEVVARVPLGAAVEILDQPTNAFRRIAYDGASGFANALYLATDADHVPYLVKGDPGCQRVALIFNIGIGFEPASGILDTLAAERAPATMFVMGWWAAEHPEILERMVEMGYPIGSHGNVPQELTDLSDGDVAADIAEAAKAIEHATGGKPPAPLFTPYAAASDDRVRAIVAASGVLPVAWEVPAADYGAEATADSVYDRVMDDIYDGAIVELHLDGPASAESTGRALPRMIHDLRDQGYQFVTIPEMAEPCP